jgi:hypothetical protein
LESSTSILESFLREAEQFAGGAPSDTLMRLTSDFLREARKDVSLRRDAASVLARLPPNGASWVAVALGSTVESGAPAADSGEEVVQLFMSYLSQLPTLPDGADDLPAPTASQSDILAAFPMLCQAVVAHLARMTARRAELGTNQALLNRLELLGEYGPGATWIREALLKSSGSLIVLHVQGIRGILLEYSNISNCFQLFSLIQSEVGTRLPGGRTPDARIASAARGRDAAQVADCAWWHYGNPLNSTQTLPASIWGEAPVQSVPVVDGTQVILLWPPILASRTWDSGFFHPHLDALAADLRLIRELSHAECSTWLNRLGIKQKRKWWKPW